MLRLCLLAAFVISTMSFPEDEVVPEPALTLSLLNKHHPELKNATPKDAAHTKIKMMQAQGFDNTHVTESKDSTSQEDAKSLLKSAGSNSIDASKLIVAKMKAAPLSVDSLTAAIDTIIQEIKTQSTSDQRMIDTLVTAFGTSARMLVRDNVLDQAQTTTCGRVAPARTLLTTSQTKDYPLDFGATLQAALAAATTMKAAVDSDLAAFKVAFIDLNTKTTACDAATNAATEAAGNLKTAKDAAYCQAQIAYNAGVADVTASSVTTVQNIKHFKMLKCVMNKFADGTKEQAALDHCSAKSYTGDVTDLTTKLKAHLAVVPSDTVCSPPPPPPATGYTDGGQGRCGLEDHTCTGAKDATKCWNSVFIGTEPYGTGPESCEALCDTVGPECVGYSVQYGSKNCALHPKTTPRALADLMEPVVGYSIGSTWASKKFYMYGTTPDRSYYCQENCYPLKGMNQRSLQNDYHCFIKNGSGAEPTCPLGCNGRATNEGFTGYRLDGPCALSDWCPQ